MCKINSLGYLSRNNTALSQECGKIKKDLKHDIVALFKSD